MLRPEWSPLRAAQEAVRLILFDEAFPGGIPAKLAPEFHGGPAQNAGGGRAMGLFGVRGVGLAGADARQLARLPLFGVG